MTHKEYSQGTDNVLADPGFDDAEELPAKTLLAVKLNELIDKRGLSQTEAGSPHRHDAAESVPGSALQAAEHLARTPDAGLGVARPAG